MSNASVAINHRTLLLSFCDLLWLGSALVLALMMVPLLLGALPAPAVSCDDGAAAGLAVVDPIVCVVAEELTLVGEGRTSGL
jgi:hypothetical protein